MTTSVTIQDIPKAEPALDNVQDLLKRKREIEMNKRRHHLTEADCNLLLTNANEFSFADNQVIGHEGDHLTSAYRVKSGTVNLMKDGKKICELTPGWFIGESVFLSSQFGELDVDLVACGPVVLFEMNVPFVQRLFEVDRSLALKFYKHIATKHSVVYNMIVDELVFPGSLQHRAISFSSTDSISSSSSDSNSTTSAATRSPSFDAGLNEIATPRRKLTKRQSFHLSRAPLKVYPLETTRGGTKTATIKSTKIEIITETLGLKFKKTIKIGQIENFVRTSEISVTIVYDNNKAKTLFFKDTGDLEEFYGVLQSIMTMNSQPAAKSIITGPLSGPKPADPSAEDVKHQMDKEVLSRLGVKKTYKKGDIVLEEGDLVQRIYMIKEGSMSQMLRGYDINAMVAGDSFGLMTLLRLRPFPTTVVVTSETAEVIIIPAFKVHELIAHDTDLAARIYQRAAYVISLQIDKLIRINKEKGYLIF